MSPRAQLVFFCKHNAIVLWLPDIGDAQEPGADVDGTQRVSQVFAVQLPAPVVGSLI